MIEDYGYDGPLVRVKPKWMPSVDNEVPQCIDTNYYTVSNILIYPWRKIAIFVIGDLIKEDGALSPVSGELGLYDAPYVDYTMGEKYNFNHPIGHFTISNDIKVKHITVSYSYENPYSDGIYKTDLESESEIMKVFTLLTDAVNYAVPNKELSEKYAQEFLGIPISSEYLEWPEITRTGIDTVMFSWAPDASHFAKIEMNKECVTFSVNTPDFNMEGSKEYSANYSQDFLDRLNKVCEIFRHSM